MSKNLPNFFVVGAAKSGTTSLYHYLNQHPDIFIPSRKECRFFSSMPGNFNGPGKEFQNDTIKDIQGYRRLFLECSDISARGDVSNDYLFYYRESIKNIKRHIGEDAKIIILLRNPIDRAYSNYLHHVREGWEALSFEDGLEAESDRKKNNWAWTWFYKETGMYFEQVSAYINNFKRIKIFLFEDLSDAQKIMNEIFEFIGVDEGFVPDTSTRYNRTGIPRSRIIHSLMFHDNRINRAIRPLVNVFISKGQKRNIFHRLNKINLKKPPLDEKARENLRDIFREDLLKLQDLIGRDLVGWIS